jgi:hypothetical protein
MRHDAGSPDLYCTFGGPIDQDAIQRFFRNVPRLTEHQQTRVHLLLQTVGGYVGDGVCLYNRRDRVPRRSSAKGGERGQLHDASVDHAHGTADRRAIADRGEDASMG